MSKVLLKAVLALQTDKNYTTTETRNRSTKQLSFLIGGHQNKKQWRVHAKKKLKERTALVSDL